MLSKRQLESAAKVMHALAHPVRLGVMQSLVAGEKNVSELTAEHGCSQPMMSQQLRILETQSLIISHKEGTQKYCAIRNQDLLKLFDCMKGHLELVLHIDE